MRFAVVVLLLALTVPANGEPDAATPEEHTLKLASFNCWAVPLVAKQLKERLAKIPPALKELKLDVICLQELWLESDQKQIAAAMAKTHPHVAHARGGLMVLSRYPIQSQRFVRFPKYPELNMAERLAGKGLLDVAIRSPAGSLRVLNTHLTWMRDTKEPRKKQLGILLKQVEAYKGQSLFVTGDFNLPTLQSIFALHPQYERILKCGLKSANPPKKDKDGHFIEPPNTRQHWPRKAVGYTGWDPDHIFFRSGKTIAVSRRSFSMHFAGVNDALSDHNLVLATLRLKPLKSETK